MGVGMLMAMAAFLLEGVAGLEVTETGGEADGFLRPPGITPLLTKCCPPHQAIEFARRRCVPWDEAKFSALNAGFDQLQPPFSSASITYDYYSDYTEQDAASAVHFEIANSTASGMPHCLAETEHVKFLLSPENMIRQSDFEIDDLNITGSVNSLVDIVTHEVYESAFCVDRAYNNASFVGTVAVVCEPRLDFVCKTRPCVSHCCAEGEVVNSKQQCDYPSDPEAEFSTLKLVKDEESGEASDLPGRLIKFIYNSPPTGCVKGMMWREEFQLLEDGRAVAGGASHARGKYCVDMHEKSAVGPISNATIGHTYEYKILICVPENPYSQGHLRWVTVVDLTIVPILFIVSLVFLALLFAYIYIKNRQKLFGAMTLCLIAMLSLFYVVVIFLKHAGGDFNKSYTGLCIASGLVIQFSYLSAIFWLNAMSYDMWSTFRKMRGHSEQHFAGPGWKHKRFKWYALYAWGCPLLVLAVTMTMEFLPEDVTKGHVLPDLAGKRCFIHPEWAMIVYLNIIIGPLICSNLILFGLSAWNLCCGVWAERSENPTLRRQQTTRYVTVTKMFFAMGITWLSEVIAHALDWAYGAQNVREVVTVFKIINSLQGLILFLVIVLDTAAIRLIKTRILGLDATPTRASTASTRKSSASRKDSTATHRLSVSKIMRWSKKEKGDEAKQNGEGVELRAVEA